MQWNYILARHLFIFLIKKNVKYFSSLYIYRKSMFMWWYRQLSLKLLFLCCILRMICLIEFNVSVTVSHTKETTVKPEHFTFYVFFYIFQIVQTVSNRATHHIYLKNLEKLLLFHCESHTYDKFLKKLPIYLFKLYKNCTPSCDWERFSETNWQISMIFFITKLWENGQILVNLSDL